MDNKKFDYDLVSLGEPLLRLSPPAFEQLRRASLFNAVVVGSQLNVAADMARLGSRAAFLTKLPKNPLGLLALDTCHSYGVDVSHIKLMPQSKMGVTYVEFSAAPRAAAAVYDRAGSAASTIGPYDFDWDGILSSTKFAYTDGIFPGLSRSCKDAANEFFASAKRNGCTTCFDVNYREHIWTAEAAKAAWSEIIRHVDIIATNRDVSELVFGFSGTDDDIMHKYAQDFGCKVVCLTSRESLGLQHGAWSSKALVGGKVHQSKRFEFDVVDRYGTGDAWFAGFLYAFDKQNIEQALGFANAFCALAHTIEGDVAHLSPDEVSAVATGDADLRVRR